jgi:hypothetical protein
MSSLHHDVITSFDGVMSEIKIEDVSSLVKQLDELNVKPSFYWAYPHFIF